MASAFGIGRMLSFDWSKDLSQSDQVVTLFIDTNVKMADDALLPLRTWHSAYRSCFA
jgi:hypothetical protein